MTSIETPDNRAPSRRFLTWEWAGLVMATFSVCAIAGGSQLANVIRGATAIGYLVCILLLLIQAGPKLLGVGSFGCAVILNLLFAFPSFVDALIPHSFDPSLVQMRIAQVVCLSLLASWLLLAAFAIGTRRRPNVALAALSVLAIVSPGVLLYLEHAQSVLLTAWHYPYWHVRVPFAELAQWLWYSR